ncbi:MAG: hypothetical protein AUK03_05805 [Anaerolineae bacterium CG2_30_64_16]|nr:MAG: hypothetical protein AUK03_05805 [Anaerolineae bacterium CG2_30_64_16]
MKLLLSVPHWKRKLYTLPFWILLSFAGELGELALRVCSKLPNGQVQLRLRLASLSLPLT